MFPLDRRMDGLSFTQEGVLMHGADDVSALGVDDIAYCTNRELGGLGVHQGRGQIPF